MENEEREVSPTSRIRLCIKNRINQVGRSSDLDKCNPSPLDTSQDQMEMEILKKKLIDYKRKEEMLQKSNYALL